MQHSYYELNHSQKQLYSFFPQTILTLQDVYNKLMASESTLPPGLL